MGEGFTVVERSMQSVRGVGMSRGVEDPQPAFDWVEEGEVQPEEAGRLEVREDIVEIVDASRDIF